MNRTTSGVLVNKDFRDSLIIDKYNTEFQYWRGKKLEHLRSENSEDAMTWNVFKTLKLMNPSLWLPRLFKDCFHQEFSFPLEFIDIVLWKKLQPPSTYPFKEGETEVDIIIESKDFLWLIEVKYKSDISDGTTHNQSRNQVIRNIDVGLEEAKNKDVYFSLLVLDRDHSPKGWDITNALTNSEIHNHLPHRKTEELKALKGIGVIKWANILHVLSDIHLRPASEMEKFIARQAEQWLCNKILRTPAIRNGATFDKTRQYRYSLTRVWDSNKEKVVFIGLNPSTADELEDDPTLKRCINFAKRWHEGKYGSLEMVNLFSYRATDFTMLKEIVNPIGPDNIDYILRAVSDASLVIIAWGENGSYKKRYKEVLELLCKQKVRTHCLKILKCGQPKHPLYARSELVPVKYY